VITLRVRNVHEALPVAIELLHRIGIRRESRNGPVLQSPEPVATVYEHPTERVIFWPERDANPFLHLYESLWMLAGHNDLAPLLRYTKRFAEFSDDGETLHGAYGYRWRNHFRIQAVKSEYHKTDQLSVIAEQLKANPEDRRCVLGMWDPEADLGRQGKDLPCNDTATFQIGPDGRLNMVVFCRSNDIVWGAYGANAVHFSYLLEYMAAWIGVPVGTYTQVSVNWHAYLKTLEPVRKLNLAYGDPYGSGRVLSHSLPSAAFAGGIEVIDRDISEILRQADSGEWNEWTVKLSWSASVIYILHMHHNWKTRGRAWTLKYAIPVDDWSLAAIEWLERRKA